jgi:hypothetical protein
MKDGILLEGCAIDRPFLSVMTQAKSFDSRTTEEKEVRTKAAAASSTIEIKRRQINSTAIAFSIEDLSRTWVRSATALPGVDASVGAA